MSHGSPSQFHKGTQLRQEERLSVGALYLIALAALGYVITGQVPPPLSTDGLWYYTGFLPLVLARFIVEPYFTRPADSMANSLALLVAAVTLSPEQAAIPDDAIGAGRLAIGLYASVTLSFSVIAMLGRDPSNPLFRIGPLAARYARTVGSGEVGFSAYLGFVTAIAFADEQSSLALIAGAWVTLMFLHPIELLALGIRARANTRLPSEGIVAVASVDPRTVVVRTSTAASIKVGQRVTWGSGASGTVVDRTLIEADIWAAVALDDAGAVRIGSLRERADIGGRRQLAEVRAHKLGTWNADEQGFDQVPWMADAGTPIQLVEFGEASSAVSGVGCIPGTSLEVGVRIGNLVSHNTAILGILGVGKTSLAWGLVARMIVEGIRVLVFDITGEYATRFGQHFSDEDSRLVYEQLENRLQPNVDNTREPKESAGNVRDLKPAFAEVLERFTSEQSSILVVNPSMLTVTAEDGFPSNRTVPLRHLSVPEVTRLLMEATLEHAQRLWPPNPGQAPTAKLCVVIEEAHSLVPEGGYATEKNEGTAAAKTARAVLQGRKYGLGCLLVTQRTANVSKTILNQCHTVFAMRSYDATSEQFLANYFGPEYASLLPSLRDRQAVVFGKASRSRAPVVIDLDDRELFKARWQQRLDDIPQTSWRAEAALDSATSFDDESDASPSHQLPPATDFDDLPF